MRISDPKLPLIWESLSNIKNKTMKCNDCDHKIDYDLEYSRETLDGEILCESCADSVWEHPPTLISYGHSTHDEGQKFYWSKQFGFANKYFEELYGDTEQTLPINGFEYVRTDGWRGYFNPIVRDEWVTFDGWSTGYVDETIGHKAMLNDFLYDLAEQHNVLYFPIWVVMAPTSNVFSMSTDIMVKKSDLERFKDFLSDGYGITLENLKTALK